MLLEQQATGRRHTRFENRAQAAKLRHLASIEDIEYRAARDLDRKLFLKLATNKWIRAGTIFSSPDPVASELANLRPRPQGLPGETRRQLPSHAASVRRPCDRPRLWRLCPYAARARRPRPGLQPLDAENRSDLLEILDDRYETRSVIVISRLPVDCWREIIGNPTIANAILNRLVHNAYQIELTEEAASRGTIINANLTNESITRNITTDPDEERPWWLASDPNTCRRQIGMGDCLQIGKGRRSRRNPHLLEKRAMKADLMKSLTPSEQTSA